MRIPAPVVPASISEDWIVKVSARADRIPRIDPRGLILVSVIIPEVIVLRGRIHEQIVSQETQIESVTRCIGKSGLLPYG
jgi:hypothetical protein